MLTKEASHKTLEINLYKRPFIRQDDIVAQLKKSLPIQVYFIVPQGSTCPVLK